MDQLLGYLGQIKSRSLLHSTPFQRFERNEDARMLTFRVLVQQEQFLNSLPLTHREKCDGVTHTDAIRVLYTFQQIGKDPLAPTPDGVRREIRGILSDGDEKGFRPASIEYYLWGLMGLTYLTEGFEVPNATRALELLDPAITQLGRYRTERQYGLQSLQNAKGICHGILSANETLPNSTRLDHLIDAYKVFASQRTAGLLDGDRYRTVMNLAELIANVYWSWRAIGNDRDKEFARLKVLVQSNDVSTPSKLFTQMLSQASDCIAEAFAIVRTATRKRPHVHFNRLILFVIIRYAQTEECFSLALPAILEENEVIKGIHDAIGIMETESLPRAIQYALTYSPIILQGLLKSDLPSLDNVRTATRLVVERLETQARAREL